MNIKKEKNLITELVEHSSEQISQYLDELLFKI